VADFAIIIGDAARRLLGQPNEALSTKTELRFGNKGSLSVDLAKGTWYDHEAGAGGGAIDLVRRYAPNEPPIDWLRREGLIEDAPRRDETVTIEFDYKDETGTTLFQVVRVERRDTGKSVKVWQRRPDASGGWVKKLGDVRRVPYRLPELVAASPGETVFVAEGEKKVELLRGWGLAATCSPGGAGKWRDEYSKFLAGRDVVILPDNDPQAKNKTTGKLLTHPDGRPVLPGQDHAEAAARSVSRKARSVRVLMLPDLPPKGDVIDWAAAGGTKEQLVALAAGAPPWRPPPDEAAGGEVLPPEHSEELMSLRMAGRHAGDLRYVAAWGKWYRWVGTHWRLDETREAFNLSRLVCREQSMTVNNAGLARAVASAKARAAVLSLTSEDPRIAAGTGEWDADPWLLCTPDGVVDLRTGQIHESRAEDMMTKIAAVGPATGDCPTWKKYLERVTDGDAELQSYLQRACGYMLTGVTYEHAMFFLYGLGANGKSTFVDAVSGVLGSYHTTAAIETFTASPNDRHPTELANLRGARLVTSTETEEGRWAESRIKALTGGDKIAARFMRQDFFEYSPTFKLVIFGNHKPGLRTVDDAFRRRMNLIPFLVKIPPMERDRHLGARLREEWGQILSWMIEGCLAWQTRGLDPPEAVVESTDKYLDQEDTFKTWLEDCCALETNAFTPTLWLFTSWKKWAERSGEWVGSQKRFVQRIETLGLTPDRIGTAGKDLRRGYRGIRLNAPASEDREPELGDSGHF